MRNLVVGLLLGAVSGLVLHKFVIAEEPVRTSRGDRTAAPAERAGAIVKEAAAPDEGDALRARIAELEARLREASLLCEIPGVPLPQTDEQIALMIEEFDRTDDLDRLLVLIRALLMQGEKGYPKLAQLLMKVVRKGMEGKFQREEEIIPRLAPALRIAMEREKELVGFVDYLMQSKTAPAPLKMGAVFAAAFLTMSRSPGSDKFAPMLLEQLTAGTMGTGDPAEILITAMGILGRKEAVEPLLAIVRDPQKQGLHHEAMNALSMIGDPRIIPVVTERLKDPNNQWAFPEMRALARIDTEESRAIAGDYLARIEDANRFFSLAGNYLGSSRDEKVVAMVIERAQRETGNEGWNAVWALSRVRSPAAEAAIEELAKSAKTDQMREFAQQVLDTRRKAAAEMAAAENG